MKKIFYKNNNNKNEHFLQQRMYFNEVSFKSNEELEVALFSGRQF